MPKEKHENNDVRRSYTLMSPEDVANGKKSKWTELEITATIRNLSPTLWQLDFLTALFLNDNNLTKIPPEISRLAQLKHLDLSSNKLRSLPSELGDLVTLRELLLCNNNLRILPNELGKLFQLQTLGLQGNPLPQDILSINGEQNGTAKLLSLMLDNLTVCPRPPERQWISLQPDRTRNPSLTFSVMCYNVLCDKYCTRQIYGYCPSWALNWEYRKTAILKEILHYGADILSLQEIETEQFFNFFLPELQQHGYDGIFSPKSRARTMTEEDRKYVDGCAIFYRTSKFSFVKEYLIEFNQLAMANASGADDMLNRVMTKDNIGIAALLELKEGFSNYGSHINMPRQQVLVSNVHIHWDPEFKDVKLIQTVMLMHELMNIMQEINPGFMVQGGKNGTAPSKSIPLVFCGDLNSLPNSGAVEFLDNGRVRSDHGDFLDMKYEGFLSRLSNGKNGEKSGDLTHCFKLQRAYSEEQMKYSNLTYSFTGVIDYIYFTSDLLVPVGVLGSVSQQYVKDNKIIGWPHPHFPSDHQSLLVEFEALSFSNGVPIYGYLPNSHHHPR
ncbi:CCR4-NOT transcription complex subunit 6-like [Porites harrisoni]